MSLRRFADPGMELAYLRLERTARARTLRAFIFIGAATLVSYMLMNPRHFDVAGVRAYETAAFAFMAVLGGLFLLTRTRLYLERTWIDLPIFVLVGLSLAALTAALNDQAAVTGFPAHAMALVQTAILVVFASIAYVGNVPLFLGSAAALLMLFAGWLYGLEAPPISKIYSLSNFTTFMLFAVYVNWDIDRRARAKFAVDLDLASEREKTEALLYNVLPPPIVARLKAGEQVADDFADLTVVFADIVDFSVLARRVEPARLVALLNHFFSLADAAAERHGLEKVKTVGDAYLAVAGGTASAGAGSVAALAFARQLIDDTAALTRQAGFDVRLRIGVHRGPAVGGVIGAARLAYDYWGDTINLASRLQGAAPPNGIAVSEEVVADCGDLLAGHAACTLDLKGVGETRVYVVEGSSG